MAHANEERRNHNLSTGLSRAIIAIRNSKHHSQEMKEECEIAVQQFKTVIPINSHYRLGGAKTKQN
jgi:hypothetical protein